MIEVSNVSKQVDTAEGTLKILDKISLSLASGESLAIVGPSGSGKSTLLGILAGLDLPSSGTVNLNGEDITAMDEEGRAAVRAQHVGFVFQSFHLLPGLTALENVALPLELQGDDQALKTAEYYLQRVGLAQRTTHYPRQLSGVNSSALPLPAPLPAAQPFCLPMSRPAIWILALVRKLMIFCLI